MAPSKHDRWVKYRQDKRMRFVRNDLKQFTVKKRLAYKFESDAEIHNLRSKDWTQFPPPEGIPQDPAQLSDPAYESGCRQRREQLIEDAENMRGANVIQAAVDIECIDKMPDDGDEVRIQTLTADAIAEAQTLANGLTTNLGGIQVQLYQYAELWVKYNAPEHWNEVYDWPDVIETFKYTDWKTPEGIELPGRP